MVMVMMMMLCNVDTGSKNVLRQAVVPTLSFQHCRAKWGRRITSNMLCASTARGKGVCSGDSGGPLVCNQGDTWLQYGITSWGNDKNCAHPDTPGVFANVVSLLPWIQKETGSQYLHKLTYCVLLLEMLMSRGQVGLGLTMSVVRLTQGKW